MSIAAGPFALSMERLVFMLAFFVALLIGWWLGRRWQVRVEPVLTQMLVGGLVSARLAFVLLYLEDYLARPVRILDFRDGGFMYEVGLLVAVVIGGVHVWRRARLRRPLAFALGGGLLAWGLMAAPMQVMEATRPSLPDLAVMDLDEEPLSLQELGGKPVVVNLWATWCAPCRREMPVLEAAQEREPGIRFVFLNQGEPATVVKDYLGKQDLALRNVLLDHRSAASAQMNSRAMPTTLFFDAEGELVDSHLGELSPAGLKARLRRIKVEK